MIISQLEKVQTSLARAQQQWGKLTTQDKRLVAEFVSDAQPPSDFDERLDYLVDLIDEFVRHHRAKRGNPGYARVGDKRDLKPVYEFVRTLMIFWEDETGLAFGHHITSGDDVGPDIWDPRSPAMEFLSHACSALGGYHIQSLETVVRNIKGGKGEP